MKDLNEVILGHNAAGTLVGSGTDASVAQQSAGVNLNYRFGIAIQAVFTGSPLGTANLQGSCDYGSTQALQPNGDDKVVNWTDIADSSASITGAGSASWNYQGTYYKWIRLNYVAASGAGTIIVRANSKGF